MPHNHPNSPTESTNDHHAKTTSVLSRREFLKHTTMIGIVGICGETTTIETTKTTESTDRPSSPEIAADKDHRTDRGFEKVLRVKGTGSGDNLYHIETSDHLRPKRVIDEQQTSIRDTVVEGTLGKDDFDSYYFAGEVTSVQARGSITYYVSKLSSE